MRRLSVILILFILGVMVMNFTGCTNSTSSTTTSTQSGSNNSSTYENIDGNKLEELMKDNNTIVVDVRETGEYQSGHLENAILIPLGQLPNQLSQLDKNKTIIVVCASGARSAQAAQYLINNGYTNVKNLDGGLYGNSQLTLVK